MTKHEVPKLFEDRKIRTVWDEKKRSGTSLLLMLWLYLQIVLTPNSI